MAERSSLVQSSEGQTTPLLVGEDEPKPLYTTSPQPPTWSMIFSAQHLNGRRIRRAIYTSFLVLFVITWTIVVIIFMNRQLKLEKINPTGVPHDQEGVGIFSGYKAIMRGHLRKYNDDSNVLTIEWEVLILYDNDDWGLGSDLELEANLAVYRDVRTVPIHNQTLISEWLKLYNATDIADEELPLVEVFQPPPPPIGYLGRSEADSVVTDINLSQSRDAKVWQLPGWGYPFDRSEGSLVLAMARNDTGASLGYQGIDLFPMAGVQLTENILGYHVTAQSDPQCNEVDRCDMTVHFVLERPGIVQFVVIVVVIVNWLITISIFLFMCESVGVQRPHILKGANIISICLTALFALPSVRLILPGAPRFGCLADFIGILPNVILISVSTTIITIAKIRNKLDEEKRREEIA